ncbi:LamG-like jellyroll fold domain-containing protein [Streptomyces sp. 4N509B]|uniref:LamG-like jellyroll fold domain-containing protein n=1 Tax=Streptomyces sp. 4N509B TaxID=3457413 RepID=UPI003FD58948
MATLRGGVVCGLALVLTAGLFGAGTSGAVAATRASLPPPQLLASQLALDYGGPCAPPTDPAMARSQGLVHAHDVVDPDGDRVSVEFRAFWDTGDGQGHVVRWRSGLTDEKASGSSFSVRFPAAPSGVRVQWEARAFDGGQYSPWSGAGSATRCTVYYDADPPAAPSIVSPEYPEANPANPLDPWHDGVGKYGSFTFDSPDADVTRYRFGLNEGPAAGDEIATSNGAARTVRLVPPEPGSYVLTAQAFDAAGNASPERTYHFYVQSGTAERMAWTLDEDADASSALGQGEPWDATLTGDAAPGGGGVLGGGLRLDGESGHAVTRAPVLDTSRSFSVSLWARLPEGGVASTATAVSQAGKTGNGFRLAVDPDGGWSFSRTASDAGDAEVTAAGQGQPAALGEWTHVVGVYKRTGGGQLLLYVNGQPVGAAPFADGWEARGPVALGAALTGQTAEEFFTGELDEVHFYDHGLTEAQVAGLHTHELITTGGRPAVAVWSFDEGADATTVAGHVQPVPAHAQGEVTFGDAGFRGNAASFTSGGGFAATTQPVLDTYQSFTVAAWVRLPDDKPNQDMVVAAQSATTTWGFSLLHASDGRGWTLRRWTTDGDDASLVEASESPCTAEEPDCAAARLGAWTHVAGVHDIDRRQIRLYVNGELVATESFTGRWTAPGRLTIGAADGPDGTTVGALTGQIDELRTFDRIATADELRQLSQQPAHITGRWQFEEADPSGSTTPDSSTVGTPLHLSGGGAIGPGWIDDGALILDGVDDHAATATGTVPLDTSTSFSLTAWARADALPEGPTTVLSVTGQHRDAVAVRYVHDPESGHGAWQLVVAGQDTDTATPVTAPHRRFHDVREWNHLALVYDGVRRHVQLYVNGMPYEASCLPDLDQYCGDVSSAHNVTTFPATHSLQIGRARTAGGAWGEYWGGAVDDVWTIQGPLSRDQVSYLVSRFNGIPTELPPVS